jgi:fatty-acyl-CoA synthase
MNLDVDSRRAALRQRFPVWQPSTLGDWLDACAQRHGERTFVITDDDVLTYGDVAEESAALARGLVALGVRPGDRVGLLMANYPEFVTVKFAIARTGAIAVPLNFLYRSDELRFVLSDSGCRVLVTMTGFGDLDYQGMLDEIVPGWEIGSSATDRQLRHVVVVPTDGSPVRDGARTIGALRAAGADHPLPSGPRPGDPGDLLYTSGTTGFPKGVLLAHDSVLRTAYASALTRAFEDGRRILFSLPCYHMFGYVEGLLAAMFVGGSVVLQPSFSAQGYLAGIAKHRATDLLCVPTMAVAMLERSDRGDHDVSSLTAVLCGSAPAASWLWQRLGQEFGIDEIVTGYGMTECGGAMTLTLPEDPLHLTCETVGRPKLAGAAGVAGSDALTVYRAVHPQTGEDLGADAEGVLVSCGPSAMIGYWNRPDDTADAVQDGWLHSGDIGRVGGDGYLRVTGRSKELYKSGGELVMPKEIEDLLEGFDDISQAFAVGVADQRWGEIGCVVVVPAPGAELTEAQILARCRTALARFKVPKQVVFRDAKSLPITPTGKVQKYRLVDDLKKSGSVT